MKKSSKKTFRDIKEIYKELIKHPDYIVFDCWDVDDIVDRIIGDIKDVKFREQVRKITKKNKKIIGENISEIYYSNYFINVLYELIEESGIFDDIIESYPNYYDEKYK
jgi:hypothetical protein